MTGRKLFDDFLKGNPPARPAFVPMIRGLLSRVEGLPMERLTSDPTLWANSLIKATRLFGFDGVVVGLDSTLLAEASGCHVAWERDRPVVLPLQGPLNETPEQSGRMRHALEAARRLFESHRSEMACMAALTGPYTLARQLFGPDQAPERAKEAKPLLVRAVEAFCATRPDVLLFLEDGPGWAGPAPEHRRMYNTLNNIASHYGVRTGLYLQGVASEGVTAFAQLKTDIYLLGKRPQDPLPSPHALWELGRESLGVGLGIPLDDLHKAGEVIGEGRRLFRERAGPGFFLTSVGPVTREVDPGAIRSLTEALAHL